jgi:predicted ATPase/DNA-binding winged helix-turn-helix (wHTH) protein
MTKPTPVKETFSFGPFQLSTSERQLTRDGVRIGIGARAFDILVALLTCPNEVVSKSDLMRQVWPGITVDEVSLRFHIAGLRRALGDGQGGIHYISTTPGQGYSFIAPVSRATSYAAAAVSEGIEANIDARLPTPTAIVGRGGDIARLSSYLAASRFVTIAGPGGIGKTSLAVALGHQLTEAFGGAICFIDFSAVVEPDWIPKLVASALGITTPTDGALPALIHNLRDRRVLLILDTCEHLVEAIAGFTARLYAEARQVHILATSRETFRSDGEHVYWLDPLACPPEGAIEDAASVQSFPATRMFVERATASGIHFNFDDGEVAVIIDICRKLEGLPLAIELAARRVEAFGLLQTAELLQTQLKMSWTGMRTAPPRQRTLRATLEWSYGLLSANESTVLRRLARLCGPFGLDAALTVATCQTIDAPTLLETIDRLVAKSLIAPSASTCGQFRLLESTRVFALEKLARSGEFGELSVRAELAREGKPASWSACR